MLEDLLKRLSGSNKRDPPSLRDPREILVRGNLLTDRTALITGGAGPWARPCASAWLLKGLGW